MAFIKHGVSKPLGEVKIATLLPEAPSNEVKPEEKQPTPQPTK